ncbi:MAG: sugar transferase [Microgenomates group bacterium]
MAKLKNQNQNLNLKTSNLLERFIALVFLLILLPIFALLYLLVRITSKGPFIFKQKRLGKDKKPFFIYKIRTMVENAQSLKAKLRHLNEADGPVFKIANDPRYTKFGRFLAGTGLDELPQLYNIIKGEMAFVGPRPLPVEEAKKIPKKYKERFSVLPGITSLWVVKGAYHHNFIQWMEDDLEYVKRKSFCYDFKIILLTLIFVFKLTIVNLLKLIFMKKLTKEELQRLANIFDNAGQVVFGIMVLTPFISKEFDKNKWFLIIFGLLSTFSLWLFSLSLTKKSTQL